MINFYLTDYVHAREAIIQEVGVALGRIQETSNSVSDADRDRLINNFGLVKRLIEKLVLSRTDDRLARVYDLFRLGSPSYADLLGELKPLLEAIEDDIKTEGFYHYPSQKKMMLICIVGDWAPTIKAFPSCEPEIQDAIDCHAFGRDTATIFHLMRVTEHGLRALAHQRQVTFPNKPLEWAQWQNMLDQIDASVRHTWGKASPGPEKDAALAFYSGAMSQFHGFKDKYRNAVMHVRKRYDELEALSAINHVRDFMNSLSSKIGEKTRKPLRSWP